MKRVVRASTRFYKKYTNASRIVAADEDDMFADDFDLDDGDFTDTLDDVADTVEDIQETVDEVQEDYINIYTENNIAGHYIAECEGCHGVFISATMESDQEVTKVTGICPLCEKETDQYLKWVIRDAEQREDTELEFN